MTSLIGGIFISQVLAIKELNIFEGTQNGRPVLIRKFSDIDAWNNELAAHTICGTIDAVAKIINSFTIGNQAYIVYPPFDYTLKRFALDDNLRRNSRVTPVDVIKQLVDLVADVHSVGCVLRVYGMSSFALTEVAGSKGGLRIRAYSLGCSKISNTVQKISKCVCKVEDAYWDDDRETTPAAWAPEEAKIQEMYGPQSDVYTIGKVAMYLMLQELVPYESITQETHWTDKYRKGLSMQFLMMTLDRYHNRPNVETLQKHLLFAPISRIQEFIDDLKAVLDVQKRGDALFDKLNNVKTRLRAFGTNNWKTAIGAKLNPFFPEDPVLSGTKTTELIRAIRNMDKHRLTDRTMISEFGSDKFAILTQIIFQCPNFIPILWKTVYKLKIKELDSYY